MPDGLGRVLGSVNCRGLSMETSKFCPRKPFSILAICSSRQGVSQPAEAGSTVTTNWQEASFPEASVAVHVTVVLPSGKIEPEGGLQTYVTPEQLSPVVGGGKSTKASHRPGVLSVVMSAGQEMDGFSVSFTVMVNWQLAWLPDASVAVQVTVVTPFGKNEPDSGVQTTVTPRQLFEAESGNSTRAPHWPGSLPTTMFGEQMTVGFVLSTV